MDALTYARFYAARKHEGQYYGVLPYTHHLQDVEQVLRRFGVYVDGSQGNGDPSPEDMYEACWLHDVVEDTDAKLRDIEELFGEAVARLVAAVTSEEGPNRRMRVALTLPKTRRAGRFAVRLKLADRIANVENGGGSARMYAGEHEEFRRGLHTPGENEDMWRHLDDLITRIRGEQ